MLKGSGLKDSGLKNIELKKAGKHRKPRYFERPEDDEKPLNLWQTLIVVLSSHLGVRPKERRQEDFRRANGLHVFIAAAIYFGLVLVLLTLLVNYISR